MFWLDANETKADVKDAKAMVKDIVDKMDSRECSYHLDIVAMSLGAHR